MSEEMKRPATVPAEAQWNAANKEWELGQKNEQGQHIGEWKWWLAPNGHLCCHSFFNDNGALTSFKRFHPNGEVSRYGTFENGVQVEDVYLKSSEPTTENFAYGNTDDKVYKAVKRPGVPVEFDYYDNEGNHLNPPIEMKELISTEEAEVSEAELTQIKESIYKTGQSFEKHQFESSFYVNTILPYYDKYAHIEGLEQMFDGIVRSTLDRGHDFIYHKGDLHLSNLLELDKMSIGALVVDGNLTVDDSINLVDDPIQVVFVTGNVEAKNIVTSGGFIVFGNLTVSNCLLGDYNHGSTFVGGNLSAKLFFPEEYFFEVLGGVDLTYAFGNSWRLNQNQNEEAFNYNQKTLADFIPLLHENIHNAATFEENKSLLDDSVSCLFEYIDRYQFMNYVTMGKPVFRG